MDFTDSNLTCADCGQALAIIRLSGETVPYALDLCDDCAGSRIEWYQKFGKAMKTTPDFIQHVAGETIKMLTEEQKVFISRVYHLLRATFLIQESNWFTTFNQGVITAIKLNTEYQIRLNINFRTGAILGTFVNEIKDKRQNVVIKEITKEVVPLGDWIAVLGFISLIRGVFTAIHAPFKRVKVLTDFCAEGISFLVGDFVDVRDDGKGFRKSGDKDWIGTPKTVKDFVNGYCIPEWVNDWDWGYDEHENRDLDRESF